MLIRDISVEEAAAVRELVLAGLAEHWGDVDPALNTDLTDLAVAHPGSRTLVALDPAGALVGTGTVVPRGDGTAELVRMSVAAGARGTGVGRALVDALVAVARTWGCGRVVLETTSAWEGTVAFYLACGFTVTHEDDGPFGRDTWFARDLEPRY
jgi:GNAT superfamily N-acetyltransferase